MAKAKTEKTGGNGELVFEKLGKDFEIPKRSRSGAYDEVVLKLAETSGEVIAIFHGGENAKAANTRRKSLMNSAEAKGIKIHAAVRAIKGEDGSVDNVLLAQLVTE